MSARRWVGTVLRARQAQEDVAAQQLADAHRGAELATRRLAHESGRITALPLADSQSVQAFHASAAARQAAGATLAAARHRLVFAEDQVVAGTIQLAAAARARRTVEKLQERDTATRLAAEAGTAQRELDEVGISRHGIAARAATR